MLDIYGYKYTHVSCVILIALPQQQWFHERASILRYKCFSFLIYIYIYIYIYKKGKVYRSIKNIYIYLFISITP